MSPVGWSGNAIEVYGVKQTIAAMEQFAPEIRKRMNKEIRQQLAFTQARARSLYPHGAWQIVINKKRLLGSIQTAPGTLNRKKWGESDPGARAAIFEFVGSQTEGDTPQVQGLIKSLNARYGEPGRFLWEAWDETGRSVLSNIRTSVLAAERDLQAKLDSIGESH